MERDLSFVGANGGLCWPGLCWVGGCQPPGLSGPGVGLELFPGETLSNLGSFPILALPWRPDLGGVEPVGVLQEDGPGQGHPSLNLGAALGQGKGLEQRACGFASCCCPCQAVRLDQLSLL